MFGNMNKPSFGTAAPNNSFGAFGTTATANANPFGQSQLFGKSATGGFGSPSTSTFNMQPTNTLFPSTQAQPTNLFQNANTTFGTPPSTQSGFGSSTLFGQQQPQTSSLFNTSSSFGQQNKPFGFGSATTQPNLFGQQPQQQQQASGLFQSPSGNMFGSPGGVSGFGNQQQQTGTVIKFNPVTGTDTMMKSGVAQSINTKHHSITCMKEYENKSFEELRFEDYAANRKGPQQQTGFASTPFGGAPVSSAPSLFGQPDASKSAFGQSTGFGQQASTFGQTGFNLTNPQQPQQQSGGLFGGGGFGANTSTAPAFGAFGATAQNANPFGAASTANKPFGSTAQPLFGTSTNTTQSTFGGGLFGQPNTQQNAGSSIFGKPAQPTMNFGQTPTSGFSFPAPASTQTTSLFQSKPLFGQTAPSTGFGQTNTFGTTTTPFANTFAKPAGTQGFGTTQTPVFGNTLGGQQQSTGLFSNTKPGGLFGNTGTGLFGNTTNTFQPNTGFGLTQQQPQQSLFPLAETQSSPNLALLTSDPFGDAPHLAGLEPKLKETFNSISTTDPKELKSLLDASKKVDVTNHNKLTVVPIKSAKDTLFEGITTSQNDLSPAIGDYSKTNYRRLVLKNRATNSGDGQSPGILGVDLLSQLESPDENRRSSKDKENNYSSKLLSTNLKVAPVRLNFHNTSLDSPQANHSLSPVTKTFLIDNSVIKNGNVPVQEKNTSITEDLDNKNEGNVSSILLAETQTKSHPCGIICTRPEYYTLPSLDDLTQYVDENGSCLIRGFTIGRKGFGNVYFPDEIDVAGLNIDELVQFRYREINVYPDDSKKPPVGQGLNRKAQVTLDKVYPRKLGTNALVTDVNELLQMNFAEKLRKVTVKKDAKFVDYRPETGSWVFRVDHFSRYGFDDSDEDSEQNGQDPTKKVNGAAVKKPDGPSGLQGQKTPEELAKMEAAKQAEEAKNHEEKSSKHALDDDIMVEEDPHFQGEEDLLYQSMYVDDMNDEEDFRSIPMDIPVHHMPYDSYKTSRNIQAMKSTLFADDDRSSDGGGSHMSIIRQYLDLPRDADQLSVVKEETVAKRRGMPRPEVFQIYNYGGCDTPVGVLNSRCYQDMGFFKGKSFRVGWSKGVDFYSLRTNQGEINGQLALSKIECQEQGRLDILEECLTESLEIVLEESDFTFDEQKIPTFTICKGATYLKRQTELFKMLTDRFSNRQSKYVHSIWTLAEALWGPGEESVSNRRHLLSEWLRSNTSCEENPSSSPAQRIFDLLSVFKTFEASEMALESKFHNISLLVSQLSLTNRAKALLQEQIDSWYRSTTADHIHQDFKKLYLLLSGLPVRDGVNVFEDVDWKRAFGMHLWYVCPAGAPVEAAIDLYRKAFERDGYTDFPRPPYMKGFTEGGPLDVLYHVMTLYNTKIHRLSSLLNPATHTSDNLDYRLSWLLLQLFLSLEVGIIDISEKTKLCTSFSNQLESCGHWEWAIFALLYLEDNQSKKNLIMGILDRNLSPEVDKTSSRSESTLINEMKIPAEWIHAVKGEKAYHLEKYFEAFTHLAYAGDYGKANDIFVERLLPNLFINEQYDIIRLLVDLIRGDSGNILRWNYETGLFLDFLELQENAISYRVDELLRLQSKLSSISDRIPHFPLKTEQQKLCVAEISKRCTSVYKELCKKSSSSLFINSYADFLDTLVMPPDFKQNEALYLINEVGNIRC